MLTSSSPDFASASADCPLQSVKLLSRRDQFTTCHINVPDEPQRLPAIALDGKFYSFFRSLSDPIKVLGLVLKLTARSDQVAVTLTNRGYVLWVHEPDSSLAQATRNAEFRLMQPTVSPAECWVISDRQPGYRACSLEVPDLPDRIPGLANHQKLYSLYRRERDAGRILKLAMRLVHRGDEVVVLVGKVGYVLCVYEPGATLANSGE